MSQLVLFIEDQIREEYIRVQFDAQRRVKGLIDDLVRDFGLPRRDFRLRPLEYHLVRARDDQRLPDNKTLHAIGIANREILRLVCPQARSVWKTMHQLWDEIESEIFDQATGEIKEKVTEEVWQGVKSKLEQLEKTRPADMRLKRYRQWVDAVDMYGGPNAFLDRAGKIVDMLGAKSLGVSVLKIGLAAVMAALSIRYIGVPIVSALMNTPTPSPTATLTATFTPSPTSTTTWTPTATLTPSPTSTTTWTPTATFTSSPTPTASWTPTATFTPSPTPTATWTPTATFTPSPTPTATWTPTTPAPVLDSDGDGLTDPEEAELKTNPLDADTDDDDLGDGEEVFYYKTDPLTADTDGDGLLDGSGEHGWVKEVWGDSTDPNNPDSDGDGLGDGMEMEQGTNPLDPNDPPKPSVRAYLKADPERDSTQCPTTVAFYGEILFESATSGDVVYQFLYPDGSLSAPQSLHFEKSGSQEVKTSLTVDGKAGETIGGNVAIQILEPVADKSEAASYTIYCEVVQNPPRQLEPPDGSVFEHYPRTTTLNWSAVEGAESYTVEIDCYHCCVAGEWCTDVGQTWVIRPDIAGTDYTFDFVGAQPGRWRVWAIYAGGSEGPKSGWWEFVYTR